MTGSQNGQEQREGQSDLSKLLQAETIINGLVFFHGKTVPRFEDLKEEEKEALAKAFVDAAVTPQEASELLYNAADLIRNLGQQCNTRRILAEIYPARAHDELSPR